MTRVALETRRRSSRSTTRPVARRPIRAAAVVALTARAQHREEHDGGTGKRAREADGADDRNERGRNNHPAERRSVERDADGEATASLERWRKDDVDRGAAHRSPAHRHHEEGRIELP